MEEVLDRDVWEVWGDQIEAAAKELKEVLVSDRIERFEIRPVFAERR